MWCLHAAVWDEESASSDAPATRAPEHHLHILLQLAAFFFFVFLHSSVTCATPEDTPADGFYPVYPRRKGFTRHLTSAMM